MSTKKKFFIGDPCYVIEDSKWLDFVAPALSKNDELIPRTTLFTSGSSQFSSTQYGDGIYNDIDNNNYGVDSGLIGFVPQELWDPNFDESDLEDLKGYGKFVECDSINLERYEDGTFKFFIKNNNNVDYITIYTDEIDEDLDDSYEEDYYLDDWDEY